MATLVFFLVKMVYLRTFKLPKWKTEGISYEKGQQVY